MNNTKIYNYSQEFFRSRQFSSDILNREAEVVSNKGSETQSVAGTKIAIIGKENSELYKVRILKNNKNSYVNTIDLVLSPKFKPELEISKEDYNESLLALDEQLTFMTETETDEFDNADFSAWRILKSLRTSDTGDDKELLKTITKSLLEFSTVTS